MESDWDSWRYHIDDWTQGTNNQVGFLTHECEKHDRELQELRAVTDVTTWSSWFHETLTSSMRVRDYIGDVVTSKMFEYGENLRGVIEESKKEMGKIALETKEDIYTLVGLEVHRQRGVTEEILQNMQKEFQAQMAEQFEVHRGEIQRGLDKVHETQPGLHRVQRLESDCQALAGVLGGTFEKIRELADKTPTKEDLQKVKENNQKDLELLEARLQLGITKDLQKGDLETGNQAAKVLETLIKAQNDRIDVKLTAMDKAWGMEKKSLQKQLDEQQKMIWELRQENSTLKEKMPIANQMSPNLVTKDELRREIDRAILFAPPVPPMVPRIDLSRLGGGIGGLFSSNPLPEEGGGATSSNPILRENEPKKTEDGHPIL